MKTQLKPSTFSVCPSRIPDGFALLVTLTLMVLLSILAIGLLSLSTVTMRGNSREAPANIARANARLAVMIALGELQKHAGDDRRITADGSIYSNAAHPHAVGVWRSWSPRNIENPAKAAPDYMKEKDSRFLGWLVSSADPAVVADKEWAKTGTLVAPLKLFVQNKDGFDLSGSKMELMKNTPSYGAMAWAVSQSATKAKITVGGPEDNQLVANDSLHAQPRPSLETGDTFKQPQGDWNLRAGRVVSMSQANLDANLWNGNKSVQGGAHFTTQGFGILSDTVNGGLKADLSLGFEMSDAAFEQDQWGSVKNPFRAVNAPATGNFPDYRGQRPLYMPLNPVGTVTANLSFPPANVFYEFPAAAVPTFTTLRSFYRTPHHIYSTADGPTIFERGADHVSLQQRTPTATSSPYSTPGAIPPALQTRTAYRPVLDRVLYVLSAWLGADNQPRLVITPIITLWNPYNTALEIEGAVTYPWIDVPFNMDWRFVNAAGVSTTRNTGMSGMMGHQFRSVGHGRTVDPYFYGAITSDGMPGAASPIRLEPGEVRVFAPVSATPQEFNVAGTIRERTTFLRPVDDPNQLSARGGLAVPMRNRSRNIGFERVMQPTERVEAIFKASTLQDYPFFVSLEDATRAKGSNPSHNDRGQVIGDVQTQNFSRDGNLAVTVRSPLLSYAQVKTEPQPFGVIETYHRTALDTPSSQKADLMYTNNPRQPYINRYLAQGNFKTGPHYETKTRQIGSLNDVVQSDNGRSFYGASNNASTGRTHLPFFEVPQAPLLSLAAFQHADLSTSAYATAYQFGNSWASAYLSRSQTAKMTSANGVSNLPVYDHSYLANESMWDSFFFSGAAPALQPANSGGSPSVWDSPIAQVARSLDATISGFVQNPELSPLRNPRFRLYRQGLSDSELISSLKSPEGCVKIAGHLLMDGSFNINSTSVEAWTAFLAGLRGKSFEVEGGNSPGGDLTGFPRFRNPGGEKNDNWNGFRALTDGQVKELAANIVSEVRNRGPFLSLGEFINRRIENSDLGLKGAIQSAIDLSSINSDAMIQTFSTDNYPVDGKSNISPANTGVGIPGYLTQADVLQSIAPVITPRSDTFTIRGYGEARDKKTETSPPPHGVRLSSSACPNSWIPRTTRTPPPRTSDPRTCFSAAASPSSPSDIFPIPRLEFEHLPLLCFR